MSEQQPAQPKNGDRIRLTARGVLHTVWGTHTVCGRKIADYPAAVIGGTGARCSRCVGTPVVTFRYASGRRERYVVR